MKECDGTIYLRREVTDMKYKYDKGTDILVITLSDETPDLESSEGT